MTLLFPHLTQTIKGLQNIVIPEDRKVILQVLINFIQKKIDCKNDIILNFICTHNSRRSHMAQVWAQTMAYYFNVKQIACYSGGTEVTALFPKVIDTLKILGFEIDKLSETNNPIYSIKYAENGMPVIGFSKTFDAPFNPKSNFAAVMTCASADADCPIILGAKRISLTYNDPKAFDNTPEQLEKYIERSLQIASEMFYVFSNLKI